MGVEVPFSCTGNALECAFCLGSFTIFESLNDLKWLCGVCGIQRRRWELGTSSAGKGRAQQE